MNQLPSTYINELLTNSNSGVSLFWSEEIDRLFIAGFS